MTSLREVLGSIVGAVGDAHLAADTRSAELARAYQSDEFLRVLPVPRVTMKTATMRLKFAVAGEATAEGGKDANQVVADRWLELLRGELMVQVLEQGVVDARQRGEGSARGRLTEEERALVRLEAAAAQKAAPLGERRPWVTLAPALLEGGRDAISKSVNEVLRVKAKTSASFKGQLPSQAELKRLAEKAIVKRLATEAPGLRGLARTTTARNLDLEVDVNKGALADLAADQIHEIEFSFDVDGVEPATLAREV